jgi:hypothetical protein
MQCRGVLLAAAFLTWSGLAVSAGGCGDDSASGGAGAEGGGPANGGSGAAGPGAGGSGGAGGEASEGPTVLLPRTGIGSAELGVLVNDMDPQ